MPLCDRLAASITPSCHRISGFIDLNCIPTMPFRNVTTEFRQMVRDCSAIAPGTKKGRDAVRPTRTNDGSTSMEKTYIAEAHNVVRLSIFLR